MNSSGQFSINLKKSDSSSPVECLGLTFENDEARRLHFLSILREKLKDPEFRKIEGFPIGEDEDILALSDPPYYTACPNPFLEDFIGCYGKPYDAEIDDYHREPFAADVSEGKRDTVYTVHSYHTKVPYKAAARYILHYTNPGDIVLDGFAGSGMTGVAAQICGQPDREFKESVEEQRKNAELPPIKWGKRRVILNDLSPAATFISANFNLQFSLSELEHEAERILMELKSEFGWMYKKLDDDSKPQGTINYSVWSDVFSCPECVGEITFLDEAFDQNSQKVRKSFPCPHCGAELTKSRMDRLYESYFDPALNKGVRNIKRKLVLINYTVGQKKYNSSPSTSDLEVVQNASEMPIPSKVPTQEIPFMHMTHQRARMEAFGVTNTHHFFLHRTAQVLGRFWDKISTEIEDVRIQNMLFFWLDSHLSNLSIQNRYRPEVSFPYNPLNGVYYISSLISEANPFIAYENKLKRIKKAFEGYQPIYGSSITGTGDCGRLTNLPNNSIDYIFTDPPFGENIYYSDLNFLAECWYKVRTNAINEAIVDRAKQKDFFVYKKLMQDCFCEYYRVLKPGRWITVVFHNSKNAVWNAIQEAITASKFVIADVRTLDKQQGSYRQVTSTAVKQDLIISAYKPSTDLENKFEVETGSYNGAWTFVQEHLEQLPPFVSNKGKAEVIFERQGNMLFDRMVAFHVQRGITVPLSASEFYAGLDERFPHRDGMYFLPEQIAEYDRKRMTVKEVLQLDLFVNDESTAVQWLRQQLTKKPQTFQELHPGFLKAIGGWAKHETTLELSDLLGGNFLRYDGGNIPKQIVSWLAKSSVHRVAIAKVLGQETGARSQEAGEDDGQTAKLLDLVPDTGLETRNAGLLAAAKDRWYIPDPNKAGDLEKLRDKALLKEFEEYRTTTKKLKVFRTEAMRAGFKHYFQQREYKIIIQVARKVPDTVLQEDPKLLMFYDNAVTRAGEE